MFSRMAVRAENLAVTYFVIITISVFMIDLSCTSGKIRITVITFSLLFPGSFSYNTVGKTTPLFPWIGNKNRNECRY
jgi:hypothetical protein